MPFKKKAKPAKQPAAKAAKTPPAKTKKPTAKPAAKATQAKKEKPVSKQEAASAAPQEAKQVAVVSQYIKDLSFENPRAPQSLVATKERPNINVNVDVKAAAANEAEGLYEVALTLSVSAKSAEQPLFVAELSYAGLFAIKGLSAGEKEQALLIYCPSILFPFARRVIADATRDGGFPPLMLDPVDFAQIYMRRQQVAQKKV